MTFSDFRAAVKAIAGDSYYSVSVEVSECTGRVSHQLEVEWRAYVNRSWTNAHETPEAVLAELDPERYANHDGVDPVGEVA